MVERIKFVARLLDGVRMHCKCIFVMAALLLPPSLGAQVLFDAHLHYSQTDADDFRPGDILDQLDANNISHAMVIGMPSAHLSSLYQLAPKRTRLMLSIYREHGDKETWVNDETLPAFVEQELDQGHWAGIGELHIFAKDRGSPVFKSLVEIAAERSLPMLIHGDPAVIDTLYQIAPDQSVIWAHAGTYPYPDLVTDYLRRYPKLMIDVSMRDERIAPNGVIDDAWFELFVTFSDRVMVGVDTYTTSRWRALDNATKNIRHWLAQLPKDVARQLAFQNAARIYRIRID